MLQNFKILAFIVELISILNTPCAENCHTHTHVSAKHTLNSHRMSFQFFPMTKCVKCMGSERKSERKEHAITIYRNAIQP